MYRSKMTLAIVVVSWALAPGFGQTGNQVEPKAGTWKDLGDFIRKGL